MFQRSEAQMAEYAAVHPNEHNRADYHWPAEWEPHEATWIAWPHNRDTWPGNFEVIPARFSELVRTLAQFEQVNILAGGDKTFECAKRHVGNVDNVTLFEIETNDAWVRDYGPTFLQSTSDAPAALVDWKYDAWGQKYPPWEKDQAVAAQIAHRFGYRIISPRIILEGGSIEGNGRGTILTTDSCLPRRNPGMDFVQIEKCLEEIFDSKILWIRGAPIAGDDTDGHIDQLVRFVNTNTVVVAVEDDPSDENYEALRQMQQELQSMTNAGGESLKVVPLPMPRPVVLQGQRLPASYANFYIANGAVIVPQFEDEADGVAVGVLSTLFPDREVIGLDATDIVLGLGAFHCLTQQQPVQFASD